MLAARPLCRRPLLVLVSVLQRVVLGMVAVPDVAEGGGEYELQPRRVLQ
jgi:hypothetical protein